MSLAAAPPEWGSEDEYAARRRACRGWRATFAAALRRARHSMMNALYLPPQLAHLTVICELFLRDGQLRLWEHEEAPVACGPARRAQMMRSLFFLRRQTWCGPSPSRSNTESVAGCAD